MTLKFTQIDAFTSKPFAGNPAAVFLLPEARPAPWMQAVAREMNLSETAFLLKKDVGFSLRWFTPALEVELCGHATLASAHCLFEEGHLGADDTARFATLSGELRARQAGNLIEMDFPATPATECEPPAGLIESLGVRPIFVGKNRFDYLVQVKTEQEVLNAAPDFPKLGKIEARGVMVTAAADRATAAKANDPDTAATGSPSADFVSRYFAPYAGIDEDPVTGSAHCTLGPYWAERLGRRELTGHQISARGGEVRVRLDGDRVFLGGHAVTVVRGELVGPAAG